MTQSLNVDPCHCHAIRKAARAVTGFYDEALAPSGLRLTQFSMLAQLQDKDGLALGALAEQLGLDRTTATRNLKLLERAGYVTAAAAEDDARRKAIRLTRSGRAVLAEAAPLWQAAQHAFEARHSTAVVGRLRAVLREMDAGQSGAGVKPGN